MRVLDPRADGHEGSRYFVTFRAHLDEIDVLRGLDRRDFAEREIVVGGQLGSVDERHAVVPVELKSPFSAHSVKIFVPAPANSPW